MGQNTSANHWKSFRKQKKALKTNGFQGFCGGDKRDRTADLLNAIPPQTQEIMYINANNGRNGRIRMNKSP